MGKVKFIISEWGDIDDLKESHGLEPDAFEADDEVLVALMPTEEKWRHVYGKVVSFPVLAQVLTDAGLIDRVEGQNGD